MNPPVCFTCGNPIKSNLYRLYNEKRKLGYPSKDILDMFGLEKECCRMIVMTIIPEEVNE